MADDGVQSGILDPTLGVGFFSPNMSLEEIKRRRAIAGALASRRRDFPKTIGEGMTYFGESLADAFENIALTKGEKAYTAKRDAEYPGAVPAAAPVPRPVAEAPPEVIPPPVAAVTPPPVMARPTPLPPAPAGPMAGVNPVTFEPPAGPANRDVIARGIMARNGAVPPGPMMTANASLAPPTPSPTVGAAPPGPAPDNAGGPNPPTVSRDIRPMLVADATGARPGGTGGVGRIPGAFDPRAPETRAPVEPPGTLPVEPQLEAPGKHERALLDYARKYSNDPDVQRKTANDIGLLKEQREKDWTIKHEKWKIDYADELRKRDPKYRQDLVNAAQENQRKTEDYTQFPLGLDKHEGKIKESYESVKNIPKAQTAIGNVRALMNSDAGMFTGADANVSLQLKKLGMALGAPVDPKASNTETFRGMIVPILSMLRPAIVGPGAQALPELQMLKDAAAGNITLERKSIENILGVIEKQGLLDAVDHHRRIIANAGNGPRSETMRQLWSSDYGLPMEQLVPPATVKMLRDEVAKHGSDTAKIKAELEEFDKDHFTPGLAAKLLGRR